MNKKVLEKLERKATIYVIVAILCAILGTLALIESISLLYSLGIWGFIMDSFWWCLILGFLFYTLFGFFAIMFLNTLTLALAYYEKIFVKKLT